MWDAGMTVAMDSIWNRLILNKAANVPTFIKIDEVGRFLTNPYLTSSFESFYSEVRKYGGYITGIIQNVNKLTNSNAARNMLANSEIVVMLRQDTMDAAELKDIYDLSKIQVDMLREAENGCGIFKCGTSFISFDGTIEPGYIYDLANTKPRHEY
jgi:methyl coenzyme M reductase beta subunit